MDEHLGELDIARPREAKQTQAAILMAPTRSSGFERLRRARVSRVFAAVRIVSILPSLLELFLAFSGGFGVLGFV